STPPHHDALPTPLLGGGRPAGTGAASTGTTQTNAIRKANTRVMGVLGSGAGPAGEFRFETAHDRRRNEGGNVAAHRRDLADKRGREGAPDRGARQETGRHAAP